MFTFCDVLHDANKKHKQTLKSSQYGLKISFKDSPVRHPWKSASLNKLILHVFAKSDITSCYLSEGYIHMLGITSQLYLVKVLKKCTKKYV